MKVKKGSIWVRIAKSDGAPIEFRTIGTILKARKSAANVIHYKHNYGLDSYKARPATPIEIDAYNRGIRNISNINSQNKIIEVW